jgi:RNA polymerase sigma-70 factor (ECF subfamily)
METAVSAYFGLLSLQQRWGEIVYPPLFLKKIESLSYRSAPEATNTVNEKVSAGASMEKAKLEVLLEEHHAAAYTWALHCCHGNQEEAKDVLQTVYLTILEGKAKFSNLSTFKTWLFSLIRKKACTAHRNLMRRLRRLSEEPVGSSVEQPQNVEHIYRSELREKVTKLLADLSSRQREVLYLVFYHELTLEEAAKAMSVSLGSARTHYHRGKEHLREQIEETGLSYELALGR